MLSFLRLCVLLLSLSGYVILITKRCRIQVAFAPMLFCAWSGCFLFAAGILNCLPVAVCLLFGGGLILLVLSVKNKYFLTKQESMAYVCFLAILVYFFILTHGSHFIAYDNFSHWATVVKDMLTENRMPNFEDPIIRFQSYPLGSSLFIYFICKIIGTADSCFLWAQLLMLASFLFCTAAFITKKNLYSIAIVLLYSIWALVVNNRIYELRVDTLLPLAGVAAFAFIYHYRKEPQKAAFGSIGIFVFIIQIKNSGIFFYAVCAICLTVLAWDYCKKHTMRFLASSLFIPLASLYLWKRHVAFAFSAGMESKHSMDLGHFKQEVSQKSTDDMLEIGLHILKQFTSLKKRGTTPGAGIETNQGLILLILLILFLAAMCIICRIFLHDRQAFHSFVRIAVLDIGCLAIYTLSVYAMYLFSMPLAEASYLASFDRYMLSAYIFVYGVTIVFTISCISALQKTNTSVAYMIGIAASLLFVVPVNLTHRPLATLVQKPNYADSRRAIWNQMLKQGGVQAGDSCFIYCNDSAMNKRYLFYLTRYELWTADVISIGRKDFKEEIQNINDYDYFIIWDSDELSDRYLTEHHLSQYVGKDRACIKLSLYR